MPADTADARFWKETSSYHREETTEEDWQTICKFAEEHPEIAMISSGCDIPAQAKWENIEAYFDKIKDLYE